ncbi:MAG: CHAP domain-containing protein [Candidatus Gastranaerophilales bacterium]|nr:CHAP domain-containing protein [Candidatus Gastranaerophilales bacterium]
MSLNKIPLTNLKTLEDINKASDSLKATDAEIDTDIFSGLTKSKFNSLVKKNAKGSNSQSIFYQNIKAVGADNVFTALDSNNDGKLSQSEISKYSGKDKKSDSLNGTELKIALHDVIGKALDSYKPAKSSSSSSTKSTGKKSFAKQLEEGMNEIRSFINSAKSSSTSNGSYSSSGAQGGQTVSSSTSATGKAAALIANARKYLGYNEANGSYKLFTNGRVEHWCADFVTYIAKQTYGGSLPSGFGSPSVSELWNWGKRNGKTVAVNNVQAGQVMIQKNNGASHTGLVTKVDRDSSGNVVAIHTIEGNTSDTVAERTYQRGSSGFNKITCFVSIA